MFSTNKLINTLLENYKAGQCLVPKELMEQIWLISSANVSVFPIFFCCFEDKIVIFILLF